MPCEALPRVALIVGHRESAQGAVSVDGTSEWDFNRALVERIAEEVDGAEVVIVYRGDHRGAYSDLPAKVNELDVAAAVSMHFNSFNGHATGSEVLHYPGSTGGMQLAEAFLVEFIEALNLPNRGTKARGRDGRGGTLLAGTAMPCVICEPFFGDNPHDWQRATSRSDLLASAYARAISQYASTLSPS